MDYLLPGERFDELQRNGYRIIQNPAKFCFGMDAVLLSGFARAKRGERVLDLGTGTGIIPILMAAKTDGDTQDFGKDAVVSCGDAQYLLYDFTVDGTIYMDGLFTYTPAEGAQMDNDARKIMFNREFGLDALRTGNYSGLLPLKGTLYETTLEAFDKLHVVFENGKVTFDTFSLVTLKEKGADPNPDPDPNPNPDLDPDPNPAGKKVEFNLLPQEWSGESTMVPEAADTGWVLKAAAGTEGGNAIGYFGTTYKVGWQLAYDFTIATGNATITGADSGLRVRSGPGTSYEILASLNNGDDIVVVADAGDGWYEITFAGSGGQDVTGYIMGEYISMS